MPNHQHQFYAVPAVNVNNDSWEIPGDPQWTPPAHSLPSYLLDPSAYTPQEVERSRWLKLRSFLPIARQERIAKCGKYALHIARTGKAGTVQEVCPVSCMDKEACPYCATRYAEEQAEERFGKIGQICAGRKVPLLMLECRVTIAEWNACTRTPGCPGAEARAKLCSVGRCRRCDEARPFHDRAAAIEQQLYSSLTKAWLTASPGSGGFYVGNLDKRAAGEDIELVVRLFVPALAVANGERVPFVDPNFITLRDTWYEICAKFGSRETAKIHGQVCSNSEQIHAVLARAHEPASARLARASGTLTPDIVASYTRAAGLAIATRTGRARRIQRSAWFGALSSRRYTVTLAAWRFVKVQPETHATVEILDHMLVHTVGPETVTGQSTRTGKYLAFPRSMCRLSSYVSSTGAPLTAPNPAEWVYVKESEQERRARSYAAKLGVTGPVPITRGPTASEELKVQKQIWGASIGLTLRKPEKTYTVTHDLGDGRTRGYRTGVTGAFEVFA